MVLAMNLCMSGSRVLELYDRGCVGGLIIL